MKVAALPARKMEVATLPARDVESYRDGLAIEGLHPIDSNEDQGGNFPAMISTAEANSLADVAAAEAESEAQRLFPDELPPSSQEPFYNKENPWRLGLTARSKERGARRIFPVAMITPHVRASQASGSKSSPLLKKALSTGANNALTSPRGLPAAEPSYRRILPSDTVSISSTVDLPSEADTQDEPAVSSSSTVQPPAPPGHPTLQRSPAGALPDMAIEAAHEGREVLITGTQPHAKHRPERKVVATAAVGDGGVSVSTRLNALRRHLEKNLKSAEEGWNDDLKRLDRRLSGQQGTTQKSR
jgi:hypothetical protein